MFNRLKAWWNRRSLIEVLYSEFAELRVAIDRHAVTSKRTMNRDWYEEIEILRQEMRDAHSNSYARIAERQLEICNRQIDKHGEIMQQLVDRWQVQVDQLRDQLQEEKTLRETAERRLQAAKELIDFQCAQAKGNGSDKPFHEKPIETADVQYKPHSPEAVPQNTP